MSVLLTFSNVGSAEVAKSFLTAAGICAVVHPSDPTGKPLLTGSGIKLLVDAEDEVRARAILAEKDFSDSELEYMATGRLPGSTDG
jgi:hypothetical protein